jgi:transketolase
MAETMRQRFYRVTSELLDTNEDLAIVLADIGVGYLEDLGTMQRHPTRAINVGIRENLMVSAAAGMALEGMRPIAHSYTPFLIERSFEQIKLDFSHQGVGGILVSVGASHDWTEGGRTHQSPEDVALMSALPDWTIHVPGHPDEVEALLRAAVTREDAVYIRLSDAENAVAHPDAGIQEIRRGGPDSPVVLAIGPMLQPTLDGTADMDVTVLYTHTPRPLDADGLWRHVAVENVYVVEPYLEGTSAAAVTAALSDLPIRLTSIGVKNIELRKYGTPAEHDRAHGIDAAGIRGRFLGA